VVTEIIAALNFVEETFVPWKFSAIQYIALHCSFYMWHCHITKLICCHGVVVSV